MRDKSAAGEPYTQVVLHSLSPLFPPEPPMGVPAVHTGIILAIAAADGASHYTMPTLNFAAMVNGSADEPKCVPADSVDGSATLRLGLDEQQRQWWSAHHHTTH